ncbi:serine/threonine protein kinase [Maudiozyma exigua]|uniref:non-specific serine/threonine protein kinase n=1 Tax=Maudiozyma exigua TaxID=34358 RepID=A0A9P6WDS9_MAUEX|nr:serine/threonine protein kinase [Kazachstania exigua]
MPKLLPTSLFHHSNNDTDHHNHNHSTQRRPSSISNNTIDSTEDNISSHVNNIENSPPVLKSTRSFLGFMNKNKSQDSLKHDTYDENQITPKPSHSMLELKRFFRPQIHKKPQSIHPHPPITHDTTRQPNKLSSPMKDAIDKNKHPGNTQSAIPPSTDSALSLSNKLNIYHDDEILAQKYGKLGKTLGSGAGGSVKILVRPSDNAIFAVKEFRPRKTSESIKEYAKKCTAEFLVGSSLHHSNVVQTMDVFSDSKQNKYFEVMEYLPVDFFAVVMTGKMSRGEINCCFKQICEGVKYLHSMGLAHRDLKLDNCCMNEFGILKLIDFGSAVIFRYPFENKIIKCHGIVGSDPYLAPEVLNHAEKYDPQCVDIWSIGIIFCCMMLKRFPWKVPKDADDNYRLYRQDDNVEHDYVKSAKHHVELLKQRREAKEGAKENNGNSTPVDPVPEHNSTNGSDGATKIDTPEAQHKTDIPDDKTRTSTPENKQEAVPDTKGNSSTPVPTDRRPLTPGSHHKKVIQGPYRLLRLLPHASRPIISRILFIDPTKRATFKDIYDDEWFQSIPTCTMDIDKKTIQRATGHHHTLVREENNKVYTYKV